MSHTTVLDLTCDRCGANEQYPNERHAVQAGWSEVSAIKLGRESREDRKWRYEICPACFATLTEWIAPDEEVEDWIQSIRDQGHDVTVRRQA